MITAWLGGSLDLAILALLVHAAWSDWRERRIANRVCLAIAGLGAMHAGFEQELPGAILAATAVLLLGILAWQRHLAGGGDVKLLAAAAIWAGPVGLVPLILGTGLAGGALAILVIVRNTPLLAMASPAMLLSSARKAGTVPYGVAIAAGAVWVWLVHHLA
jgi:prepilin peptidase CpaA